MYKLKIRNEAEPDILDIYLYSSIEHEEIEGAVSAVKLREELESKPFSKVILHVNSDGGDLMEALAMHDYLSDLCYKGHSVEAVIEGICASSAVIVVMAAEKITMSVNSYMMIHEPYSYAEGTSEEFAKYGEVLAGLTEKIINIIAERTGLSTETIIDLMRKESWLNADTCMALGFCDEIFTPAVKREPESVIENRIRDSRNIQVSSNFKPIDKTQEAIRNMAEMINRKRGYNDAR